MSELPSSLVNRLYAWLKEQPEVESVEIGTPERDLIVANLAEWDVIVRIEEAA